MRSRSLIRHTLLELRHEEWFRNSVEASEGPIEEEDAVDISDATSDDGVDSEGGSVDGEGEPMPASEAAGANEPPPSPPPLGAPPLPPPPLEDLPASEAVEKPESEAAGKNESVAVVASDLAPGSLISQRQLDALIELGDKYQASKPPAPKHRSMPTAPKNRSSTVESRWFHGKQFHEWKQGL